MVQCKNATMNRFAKSPDLGPSIAPCGCHIWIRCKKKVPTSCDAGTPKKGGGLLSHLV